MGTRFNNPRHPSTRSHPRLSLLASDCIPLHTIAGGAPEWFQDDESSEGDNDGVSANDPRSVASEICPEGIEDWIEIVDQALHGLHHALNNRIGSLSALVELHQLEDLPANDPGFASLDGDIKRLQECNRMARLLPRDGVSGDEALILDDVFADVFAIHRYLHDLRDVAVTIAPSRYVEPVREQRVRIEFRVGSPPVIDTPTSKGRYAETIATGFGGAIERRPGAVVLRLPTLKARRVGAPRSM
jgi:hypothetical protein